MTANHSLGHFSAFVAMGIGVFHSFVLCEKRGVLLPLLACPLKCAEEGGELLWSATEHQEETSVLGTGCEVTLFKLSPAVQSLPLWWLLLWGGDAEHTVRHSGPGGPAPPALGVRCYQTLPE